MSLESGAISRRIHGDVSLYDYAITTPMQTLPISDDWLPMRGAYPHLITYDTTTPRPVIEVGRFTNSYFNANVSSWKETLKSNTAIPNETYYELAPGLSVPPVVNGVQSAIPAETLSTALDVATWVYRYPLRTVEAISNIADYGVRKWEFPTGLVEETHLFYIFTMAERPWKGGPQVSWQNQMAVFVIPPWLMSLDDFRDFTKVEMIRDFRTSAALFAKYGDACLPTEVEAIWVQIFDHCERRKVQTFALTSWNHWVFGGFQYEDDKCHARVSSVRTCTDEGPTILQTLLFFMRSVEMRDIGLSSQWSSISWLSDRTARWERDAEKEKELILKRKHSYDDAQEVSNKRQSPHGSANGGSSHGSEATQRRQPASPDPPPAESSGSKSSSASGSQASGGSGSHRRRRKRSTSIPRPSSPSPPDPLPRSALPAQMPPAPAPYSLAEARSLARQTGLTTPRDWMVHAEIPHDDYDLSNVYDPSASEFSSSFNVADDDNDVSLDDEPMTNENWDGTGLRPGTPRPESSFMNLVSETSLVLGRDVRTPDPRSPVGMPEMLHRDADPDVLWRRYGARQQQSPGTPTPTPVERRRSSGATALTIARSPSPRPGLLDGLGFYYDDSSTSSDSEPTNFLMDLLPSRRPSTSSNAVVASAEGSSPSPFDAIHGMMAEIGEQPLYNVLTTALPVAPQRDVGMGTLEFIQWEDTRRTNHPDVTADGDGPRAGPSNEALQDVSNSGESQGSGSTDNALAAHFRSAQPSVPAILPIQDVVTSFNGHPFLDPDADPLEAAAWAASRYERIQEENTPSSNAEEPDANADDQDPMESEPTDRSESVSHADDEDLGDENEQLAAEGESDTDTNRHTWYNEALYPPYPDARSRSASFGSRGASTLWDGERGSVGATVVDPDDRRSPFVDDSPASSPAPHSPAPQPAVVESENTIQIHPDPYRREYTPNRGSEAYSFRSDFSTNAAAKEMHDRFKLYDQQLNYWREQLPPPDEYVSDEAILNEMPRYVAHTRRAVRGDVPSPSAESSPGTPADSDQFEGDSDGELVTASQVSSPATNVPNLPELDRFHTMT